jgi:hypothetical protein
MCHCGGAAYPAVPVGLCGGCESRPVPAGAPEWFIPDTQVPTERGSQVVLSLRVRASKVAAA